MKKNRPTILPIFIVLFLLPCLSQAQIDRSSIQYEDVAAFERDRNEALFLRKKSKKQFSGKVTEYDAMYYKLDLDIRPDDRLLAGSVLVRGRSIVAALDTIALSLHAAMQVDSIAGEIRSWRHSEDELLVVLNSPVVMDSIFTIEVFYQGNPASGGFGGFGFNRQNNEHIIWSLSEPYYARTWWPCKDYPNDKADSVDIILTVPENLTAVSNGSLVSVVTNADQTKTFHWFEKYPITTYLVSVAITNYEKYSQWFKYSPTDSMEITHYIYPGQLDFARGQLTSLPDMLAFFHQTFGPYPFLDEKYGIAQFPWGGGMEHQTISSQGGFGETLNVHELAHQWFGDLITAANWPDIWMNEGFAAYSEALYFEHRNGADYYHTYMSFKKKKYTGTIYRTDTTTVGAIFNRIVYDKGAWVLHMLRKILGDETFFGMLRAYVADSRFAFNTTSTDRFRKFCEDYSDRNLEWFFNQWIYGSGRPVYQYCWESSAGTEDYLLDLQIEQTQLDEYQLFVMPLDFHFSSADAETTVTVFNDRPSQNFEIHLRFNPETVLLDRDNWVLKRISPGGCDSTAVVGYKVMQSYPNPFTKSTRINVYLPFTTGKPVLQIYDIRGRLVRKMRIDLPNTGANYFNWDGHDDAGMQVASGIYYYTVSIDKHLFKKKMVYIH